MSEIYPHLVVGVICQQGNKILMVNEIDNGINCWNQPAGHVEYGETIQQAAIREALEETGYRVQLTGIQGIYQGLHQQDGTHFVRISFTADAIELTDAPLDADIIQAQWLDLDDLRHKKYTLRSEITQKTLEDLGKAPIFPTTLLNSFFPGDSE